MKQIISLSFLMLFSIPLFGQKGFLGQKDSTCFFNEFTVSINRTAINDNNTENRSGFGAGIYHSSSDRKKVNFVFGFEYNRTSQFKEGMPESRWAHSSNVTLYINTISVPLSARVNFGKATKAFVEAGFYLEFNGKAKKEGTMSGFSPNEDLTGIIEYEYDYSKKSDIKTLNFGPSLGVGLKIPLGKHKIIVKADYKYGVKNLSQYRSTILNRYFRLSMGYKL